MDAMWRDVRMAVKGLLRRPLFTALAGVTLAIGIGANTAIYSVVDGVLINPLPFPESERLLSYNHEAPGLENGARGQNAIHCCGHELRVFPQAVGDRDATDGRGESGAAAGPSEVGVVGGLGGLVGGSYDRARSAAMVPSVTRESN